MNGYPQQVPWKWPGLPIPRGDGLKLLAEQLTGTSSLSADEEAALAQARYESWREIMETAAAEERRQEAYDRLEFELRFCHSRL